MRTVVHFSDSNAFGGTEKVLTHLLAGLDRQRWRPVLFHHDFSACSLFVVVGMPLLLGGISFGAITWIHNSIRGLITPTGTVMLAVVPLLLGFQLLLEAIVLDIQNVPKIPIHTGT